MQDRISVNIEAGVADVRLTRADKMNALDPPMFTALIETAKSLEENREVRCAVLSGEGKAFCAGLDMASFAEMASGSFGHNEAISGPLEERTHGIANNPQQAVWAWRQLRVPVIAAVHGAALGGGFQLMLGADIRVVHPQTKLAILEAKWGLVPDMSAMAIFRHLAREDVVRELTYTGRFFSGDEAAEYGFASHLSTTPHEDAMSIAGEIAARSPDSVQAAKTLFNGLANQTEAEILLAESKAQDRLIGRPNQMEAVRSGLEKREPNFSD